MNKISNEETLLNEWQERLGLQDWAITLRYNCDLEDLELENSCGETEWSEIIKSAVIKIISQEAYGYDRVLEFDFEKILVHELLHIKFGLIDVCNQTYESKVVESARHQLIDDLARALVMAKRGTTKREISRNIRRVLDFSNRIEVR